MYCNQRNLITKFFDWIFSSKVDGKTDYFVSGKKFAKLLKERYE